MSIWKLTRSEFGAQGSHLGYASVEAQPLAHLGLPPTLPARPSRSMRLAIPVRLAKGARQMRDVYRLRAYCARRLQKERERERASVDAGDEALLAVAFSHQASKLFVAVAMANHFSLKETPGSLLPNGLSALTGGRRRRHARGF